MLDVRFGCAFSTVASIRTLGDKCHRLIRKWCQLRCISIGDENELGKVFRSNLCKAKYKMQNATKDIEVHGKMGRFRKVFKAEVLQ